MTSPRPIVPNPNRPAPTQPPPGTPSPMDPGQRPPTRPRYGETTLIAAIVDCSRAWGAVWIAVARLLTGRPV